VFAAQMINFPVAAGTSAHLVGGALLAITLGPAAAAVVMAAILAVQAFVFQDGGILALGANVFNMGIAGVLAAWLPYRLWGGGGRRRAAIFAAGALSVMVSALLAVSELLASGVPVRPAALAFLLVVFGVSAAVEGAITVAVVRGIEKLSPRIIRHTVPSAPGFWLSAAPARCCWRLPGAWWLRPTRTGSNGWAVSSIFWGGSRTFSRRAGGVSGALAGFAVDRQGRGRKRGSSAGGSDLRRARAGGGAHQERLKCTTSS